MDEYMKAATWIVCLWCDEKNALDSLTARIFKNGSKHGRKKKATQMKNQTELKPCPFCGEKPKIKFFNRSEDIRCGGILNVSEKARLIQGKVYVCPQCEAKNRKVRHGV